MWRFTPIAITSTTDPETQCGNVAVHTTTRSGVHFWPHFFFCIATRQHKIAELTCLGDSTHIPKKHTHYNVHTRVRYTCMSRIRQSHTRLLLQMSYVKYSAVTVRVRLSLLQFINMYMGIDKLGVVYLCHSSQALNASPRVHLDMYVLENNLKH